MQEVFEKIIEKLEVQKENVLPSEKYLFGNIGVASVKGFNRGIKNAIEIVKQATEEYNNGWIPCSERFPSKEEFKEAYCRNKYGAEFIVMIEGANRPTTLYLTSDGLWVDDCRNVHEVLAWRPLPESYTKGE